MLKKLTILFLFFAVSCNQYEIPEVFRVAVMVKYPAAIAKEDLIRNALVTLTNKQTGRIYTSTTDNSGYAYFEVRGGNYDITTSSTEDRIIEQQGSKTTKTLIFNGDERDYLITADKNEITVLTEYSVLNSSFVIKELYVSGSRTPEGKSYAPDKFIEIYNNSDKVLFADGLCYGAVFPSITTRPTTFVNDKGDLLDRCPVWSYIPIVPGSGKEHPIQPGESFVIALQALNHKDDQNGNPNSLDLSGADWEMYVEDGKYADIPSVPNMLMQRVYKGTAISLAVRGQVSIIFRLPSNDFKSIFSNPDNFMIEPGGTERSFMVPWSWIIDGVENVWLDNEHVYKRLISKIDLGYIQFRGSYEKVSIRRKVKEVINGRIVYQDTNNSTEDFLTNQEPQPGIISAY